MCSPLGVSRGARDVKPTNDNDPVAYQVKKFVDHFGCPLMLYKQTLIEPDVMSEKCQADLGPCKKRKLFWDHLCVMDDHQPTITFFFEDIRHKVLNVERVSACLQVERSLLHP